MSPAKKPAAAQKKTPPSVEFRRAERAAKFILAKTKLRPRIALVLGSGRRLFDDCGPDFDLQLMEETRTTTGVIIATYRRRRSA